MWHYLPDYDYRPDLFVYAEFHTTDPDYVVVGVGDVVPIDHSHYLSQIQNALAICLASVCDPPAPPQAVRRVDIAGIPERMFASRRLTSVLTPDVAVWTCQPSTPPPHDSYWYDRDGAPGLVLEVVTSSTAQARAHDMAPRRIAYARMGVREFWLLDTRQDFPLMGFTLDAKDGDDAPLEAYRPLAVGPGADSTAASWAPPCAGWRTPAGGRTPWSAGMPRGNAGSLWWRSRSERLRPGAWRRAWRWLTRRGSWCANMQRGGAGSGCWISRSERLRPGAESGAWRWLTWRDTWTCYWHWGYPLTSLWKWGWIYGSWTSGPA